MKKQLLLVTLFLGAITTTYAQQDKALTHFMFDRITVNPAATALKKNHLCGTFIYRNQWDKINGAPNSGTFNVEADLDQYVPNFFAGISFFQDMIGFNRQNFATLNFGYSFKQWLPFDLRAGVGLGIMNHSVDPLWLPPSVSASIDPSIDDAAWSRTGFDANFGLYARHTMSAGTRAGDSWNFGISMTHLPAPDLQSPNTAGSPNIVGFQSVRHMYIMGGYKLNKIVAGRDDIDIQFMAQTDQVEFSTQISARYMYDGMLYGGLNFRTDDMIGLMAGVNLANVSGNSLPPIIVGYAYDFSINALSSISQGSHEVMVKYCYPLPGIPMTITRHPRWL